MFGVDWSDPQTLWLNMTNLMLGIVTLICVAAIGFGIVQDLLAKRQASAQPDMDREMNRMLSGMEAHVFHSPELGLTMADGGEPERPASPKKPGRKQKSK